MLATETKSRKSLLKWTLRVAFVLAVTGLTWFSVPMAIMAVSASILVAVQARASTLIEVSFGPLKAKLEREITEAEKLVGKLREFAALQAKAVISASARIGRWADSGEWTYDNLREMERALRELGVSEDTLRSARADLIKYAVSDAGYSALGTNEIPKNTEAVAEWKAIRNKGLEKTPDEIEAFLKKWDWLTPERQTLINDMRWMIANQDIQDREQFLRIKEASERL